MAEFCTLKEKICPFAGIYKANIHCGLKTGILEETKIINMTKCPYKAKKRKR